MLELTKYGHSITGKNFKLRMKILNNVVGLEIENVIQVFLNE